jgi:hypothetical protein
MLQPGVGATLSRPGSRIHDISRTAPIYASIAPRTCTPISMRTTPGIAFRKTGKHRRLRIEDVLEFKEKRDKDRRAGLRELSQMTQEFGGYDSELK